MYLIYCYHLALCFKAKINPQKNWVLQLCSYWTVNLVYSFLTCSQMQIYIQNVIVTNFHCCCVISVAWPLPLEDITLLARLLRYIVCFAGQNRWMSEANRSECGPYIYQQCYCFLYGCLNSYSCSKGIFTPSKFTSCFISACVLWGCDDDSC